MGVGLALAVVYVLASSRAQSWVARRSPSLFMAVTVSSFLVRLAAIAVILVILGLWTPLNVVAVCLAFAGGFTIFSAVSITAVLTRSHATSSAESKTKALGETDAGC